MSTIEATRTTTPESNDTAPQGKTLRVFLIRGIIAVVWAVVFAAVSSLSAGVTIGVGILLVLYPLIDVIASVIDARSQQGSARRLLLINAGGSAVAAIALAVAATASAGAVFAVFGAWAFVSGAAQFITAIRRRRLLGKQVPMLLAGGVSVLLGAVFIVAAVAGQPMLTMLAIYAGTGGIDFVIQAGLVARRRRHQTEAAPLSTAS